MDSSGIQPSPDLRPDATQPLTSGVFYSDVHGELWLLISMRGLFQINQISFRRTQIKVQKHLRDDEEQHKALSAKVQGPYQSSLMSVEHFRCTCSEVSKTNCREILYFLTTADEQCDRFLFYT